MVVRRTSPRAAWLKVAMPSPVSVVKDRFHMGTWAVTVQSRAIRYWPPTVRKSVLIFLSSLLSAGALEPLLQFRDWSM